MVEGDLCTLDQPLQRYNELKVLFNVGDRGMP
jgi:hypothetical protein